MVNSNFPTVNEIARLGDGVTIGDRLLTAVARPPFDILSTRNY
jgi:hypothetical protein